MQNTGDVNLNQPPRGDATAVHVWLVLWKAAHAIEQNALRSVSSLGLGLSEFAVLEVLLHKGPQKVNLIGKKVFLTSGSMTAAIDRLETRNLVQRSGDPLDRRSRVVNLTETGRRTIEEAFRKHVLDMEEVLAVLSPEERLELIRLLKKAGVFAAARLDVRDRTP